MPNYMIHAENACSHLVETAQDFDPDVPLKERLEAYKTMTTALKMMAYAPLLSFGDINLFYKRLMCCAFNWREFLQSCHAKGEVNRVPASMNDPFLCALVCGRYDVAVEIAKLSSTQVVQPEYDDEFYIADFLHTYVLQGADTADKQEHLKSICESIVEYLEETPYSVDFYNALVEGDIDLIAEAFTDWNSEIANTYEEQADAPGTTYSFEVTRHIWLEGLALIKFLNHKGIGLTENYKLIPAITLKTPDIEYDETWCILGKSQLDESSFK